VQKINGDLRWRDYARPMTPGELSSFVRSERELWGPIVRQIGIAASPRRT
jgi:hypothetical protein